MNETECVPDGTTERRSKVTRLLEEYNLEDVGEELEQRWTATGEEHESLRDLAAYLNVLILESGMEEAGAGAVGGEAHNFYRLLTDDDTNRVDQVRTERRLKRQGVDVDRVCNDFVSYQAVRTYPREVRGVEYDPRDESRIEREILNVKKLSGRTEAVTKSKVEQLRDSSHLDIGEFNVLVNILVVCTDCGKRYEIVELLESGHCQCAKRSAE